MSETRRKVVSNLLHAAIKKDPKRVQRAMRRHYAVSRDLTPAINSMSLNHIPRQYAIPLRGQWHDTRSLADWHAHTGTWVNPLTRETLSREQATQAAVQDATGSLAAAHFAARPTAKIARFLTAALPTLTEPWLQKNAWVPITRTKKFEIDDVMYSVDVHIYGDSLDIRFRLRGESRVNVYLTRAGSLKFTRNTKHVVAADRVFINAVGEVMRGKVFPPRTNIPKIPKNAATLNLNNNYQSNYESNSPASKRRRRIRAWIMGS